MSDATTRTLARVTPPRREREMAPAEIAAKIAVASLATGPFVAKDRDVVLSCTIPGDPLSKQRPRFSRRGHAYTPPETRLREQGIRLLARPHYRELGPDQTSLFSLRAAFYIGSNQRRDADNMLKLVSDALTGLVWADDSQVVEVFAFKVPADRADESRTEIVVARMPGMMPYQFAACALCKRQYRTYPSWKFRMFCSRRCSALSQTARIEIPCSQCSKPVQRIVSAPKTKYTYCSWDCRRAHGTVSLTCKACGQLFTLQRSIASKRTTCSATCAGVLAGRAPRDKAHGTGVCACGARKTRNEYAGCRACYMRRVAERVVNKVRVRIAPREEG